MKTNKKAESLVGIVIGIVILSVVLLGLGNLIGYSNIVLYSYKSQQYQGFLSVNFNQILEKIDTSDLAVGDTLYVYKDVNNSQFLLFTGALNDQYQYVDHYGNKVDDLMDFPGDIYTRYAYVLDIDTSGGFRNMVYDVTIEKYNR